MELRPYQAECIETIEAQPPGAFLAQMATGLGKTVTFANIPRHGERMLILSHREELVEQPRKYFNCSYGIERAKQHSHGEEVVSASIQTLARRLSDFDPEDFRLIICDEAHHAAASTYRKIFDYFRPEKLIGFTATPNRGDKVRLDTVFSKIIFQRDLRWGVKNGYHQLYGQRHQGRRHHHHRSTVRTPDRRPAGWYARQLLRYLCGAGRADCDHSGGRP